MNPFKKKYAPELPFRKEVVEDFLYYFNTFYGADGVYPIRDTTFAEMVEALYAWKSKIRNGDFHGDTVDRENVRDIIFTKAELDKVYGRVSYDGNFV